jgi:hypothetical protein
VKGRRRPLQQARTTAASDILRLCCSRVEQAGGASASLRSLPCCAGNERDDCVRTGRWRWAAGCFGGGGGGWDGARLRGPPFVQFRFNSSRTTLNVAAERANGTIASGFPSPTAEKRTLKTIATVHGVQLRSFYRHQCGQSNTPSSAS